MNYLLAAPLFLALAAASAPPVSVVAATGDWSDLPQIGDNGTIHQSKNLMLALEEHFDVEFSDRMLGRKTFSSIRSLAEAIEELRGPAQPHAPQAPAPEIRA